MFFRNNLPIAFLSLSQPRAAWMELEMKFQANQRVNSEQPHVPQQEGQPKPRALVLAPCGVQNPSTALTKAAEPAEQIQSHPSAPAFPAFPSFLAGLIQTPPQCLVSQTLRVWRKAFSIPCLPCHLLDSYFLLFQPTTAVVTAGNLISAEIMANFMWEVWRELFYSELIKCIFCGTAQYPGQ